MSNRLTNLIAGAILLFMALLSISSVANDSTTFDELAHIPAGYSYLTQKDMRFNLEQPPLIKDIAAMPLLFLNLNFPEKSIYYWNQMPTFEFEFGNEFLYYANRNPDQILFFARLPMIFILLIFGGFLFRWAKSFGGNNLGLLVLTLFAFSPNFLAHGRLVTTDVGVTAAIFIAFCYFLKFVIEPSKKNIILTGLLLGIALLTKFSAIILIPVFIIILVIRALLFKNQLKQKNAAKYCLFLLFIFLISFVVVGIVYQIHVINLPIQTQSTYTRMLLSHPALNPLADIKYKWLVDLCVWMSGNIVFRPYALYLFGLLTMAVKTFWGFGASGIPTYFFEEISAKGRWYYFPLIYFVKVPLAFHIMSLIAIFYLVKNFFGKMAKKIKSLTLESFTALSMMILVLAYLFVMITGSLNLGVRHLLPIFPFLYILICSGVKKWISSPSMPKIIMLQKMMIGILFFWYIFSSISIYPFYLTYFNELAGGPNGGSRYVVDSNLDWGQDLKRLRNWVEKEGIEKIKIDYFGGGNPEYYFGQKYEKFDAKDGIQKGWLAISATLLRGGQGRPAPGFKEPTGYYNWLKDFEPITVIGNSIFIYHID